MLPTGLATIFVTLARLSLAGLHPCRAQLRFPGHPKYSWSLRCSVKIDTSAYRAGQFKIDTSAYRVGQFKIDISAYRVGDDRVRKNTLNNPCG